jgi:hypothetical protein
MIGGEGVLVKSFEFKVAGWGVCCGVQMSLTVSNPVSLTVSNPVFVCKTCGVEKPVEWEVKTDA